MAMTIYTDETAIVRTARIELAVEELEEVIAPAFEPNHNEILVRDAEGIELNVEELEEVIAPGLRVNHSETFVRDAEEIELDVEELEEVIAPRVRVDQPDPPNRPQPGASGKRRLALAQFGLNEHGEAIFTRS